MYNLFNFKFLFFGARERKQETDKERNKTRIRKQETDKERNKQELGLTRPSKTNALFWVNYGDND